MKIQWHTIDKEEDLEKVLRDSHQSDQLIFKHSNACGISNIVKSRLEKESQVLKTHTDVYLINVLRNRTLSNQLAELLTVRHESPQILLISDGECIFHSSHFDVSLKNIPLASQE